MAPMPALQRRYSVTGQTPPDNEVPKQQQSQQQSPKLQALDTSVQSTPSCGLCDPGPDPAHHEETVDPGPESDRGRTISHQATARMVSKRSATQLPSPNTPTSHELPPKIAKLGLKSNDVDTDTDLYEDEDMDMGMDVDADADVDAETHVDTDVDEGIFTDMFFDTDTDTEQPWPLHKTAPMATPYHLPSLSALPSFDSDSQYDSGVESLALTPPASVSAPETPDPLESPIHIPTTLLTLPPELRHQIYLHLPDLVLPYPLIYCLSTFTNNVQHPLASVNSLIRREALAIFYSYNTWTIKLEFKMMYEAFQDWIIRLGDGAGLLRLVTIAVRGKLFKPRTSHAVAAGTNANPNANGANANANAVAHVPGMPAYALVVEQYSPPDGDASFSIDLSEKFPGGKVALVRNEGTVEAGEVAVTWLRKKVRGLWEKRRVGKLNGQDWVDLVDEFLRFAGWF